MQFKPFDIHSGLSERKTVKGHFLTLGLPHSHCPITIAQ